MSAQMSLLSLFLGASWLVKGVMLLLLLASVLSWSFILRQWQVLKGARGKVEEFEHTFWSGIDLNKLYQKLSNQRSECLGPEAIFAAGFREFARLSKQGQVSPEAIMQGSERAMRVALHKETERLEQQLSLLATIGSISPYIGLFGTVWGMMNSLRALGSVQQASLNMVAPGMAEALIATAMGLFVAIPAVAFYNKYAAGLQKIVNHYQTFAEEFTSILHRQAHAKVNITGE